MLLLDQSLLGATKELQTCVSRILDNAELSAFLSLAPMGANRGRDALANVLVDSPFAGDDPTSTDFPHRYLSLSHSENTAIALRTHCIAPGYEQWGTGVDMEFCRTVNPKAARFFLNECEMRALRQSATGSEIEQQDLLRLWTVKESLYKADISNQAPGRLPGQYIVADVTTYSGIAFHPALPAVTFVYSTITSEDSTITIAIAMRRVS